ncbi:hypothetical protein BDW59DRAFT_159182 [Aspergillus cavernicola]|uniref:Protein kinase domain-containing protein n=1 Tax=Aspergillus cavernicola TaxID=176166 RepID=A0ABR4IN50_9EURO
MSGMELVVGVIGAADVCFRYGKSLIEAYRAIQVADTDIKDNVIVIEAIWTKVSLQLRLLERIWTSLNEKYRGLQEQVLAVLARKLEAAILQLSKADKRYNHTGDIFRGFLSRSKYVILVKKSLDQAIQELKDWQGIFDPTWYVTTTNLDGPIIDGELARGNTQFTTFSTTIRIRAMLQDNSDNQTEIFLSRNRLATSRYSDIQFSTSQLVDIDPTLPPCILDSAECAPDADIHTLTKDVRSLASRLRTVNPLEFHLFNCFGVVKARDHITHKVTSFHFVFRIPKGLQGPRSLREHLLYPDAWSSITDKLRIAKQLAISISSVHTLKFVHKNVRPETILILRDSNSIMSSLFLVGFKTFRMADGRTLRKGDAAWETNLYRHPDRQWLQPEADYTMQHDMYSLGVCLLEIGLGESFVVYDSDRNLSTTRSSAHLSDLDGSRPFKDHLLVLARQRLPKMMGNIYTRVVVNCLTCTDEDNEDFGDESQFYDEDGVLIGVAYIEKVRLDIEV